MEKSWRSSGHCFFSRLNGLTDDIAQVIQWAALNTGNIIPRNRMIASCMPEVFALAQR
jgi:hypothetical protein